MPDGGVPPLNFSSIRYTGQQGRRDLRTFLYRGAASMDVRQADAALKAGALGPPLMERLPLLRALHAEMDAALVAGGSVTSLSSCYRRLARLFSWADKKQLRADLQSIREVFVSYTEEVLIHRQRLRKESERTIYQTAHGLGLLIDKVLDRRASL